MQCPLPFLRLNSSGRYLAKFPRESSPEPISPDKSLKNATRESTHYREVRNERCTAALSRVAARCTVVAGGAPRTITVAILISRLTAALDVAPHPQNRSRFPPEIPLNLAAGSRPRSGAGRSIFSIRLPRTLQYIGDGAQTAGGDKHFALPAEGWQRSQRARSGKWKTAGDSKRPALYRQLIAKDLRGTSPLRFN